VTVKGVSERDVRADLALWPIRYVSTHDDLGRAQGEIKRSHQQVLAFLEKHGIDPGAAEVQMLEVNDRLANPYQTDATLSRYIVSQSLMVRTQSREGASGGQAWESSWTPEWSFRPREARPAGRSISIPRSASESRR
jgi:hypothetical protein